MSLALLVFMFVFVFAAFSARAARFVPASDSEALERPSVSVRESPEQFQLR